MDGAADGGTSGGGILAVLRAAGGIRGKLRFDRFLELALYDPRYGFYSSGAPRLGRAGDYYTAAHVGPVFGQCVAARIWHEFERLGRPTGFRVVEVGPGDGSLARVVAESLSERLDGTGEVEYRLVDRSAPLLDRALTRAGTPDVLPGIRWRSGPSLSVDGPFSGVVIANELMDALPFRRLLWRGSGWVDLEVDVRTEPLRWAEGGPVDAPSGRPYPVGPREGAVLEVSAASEAFVREVGDHLAEGTAILIDYGLEQEELLQGHPSGTLAGVRRHRPVSDPLADPGEVDLSSFVNFSRVRAAARSAGLAEVAYRSQAEALGAWGFPGLLERHVASLPDETARVRAKLEAKNLLFGFASFRVLELSPHGVAASAGPPAPKVTS